VSRRELVERTITTNTVACVYIIHIQRTIARAKLTFTLLIVTVDPRTVRSPGPHHDDSGTRSGSNAIFFSNVRYRPNTLRRTSERFSVGTHSCCYADYRFTVYCLHLKCWTCRNRKRSRERRLEYSWISYTFWLVSHFRPLENTRTVHVQNERPFYGLLFFFWRFSGCFESRLLKLLEKSTNAVKRSSNYAIGE